MPLRHLAAAALHTNVTAHLNETLRELLAAGDSTPPPPPPPPPRPPSPPPTPPVPPPPPFAVDDSVVDSDNEYDATTLLFFGIGGMVILMCLCCSIYVAFSMRDEKSGKNSVQPAPDTPQGKGGAAPGHAAGASAKAQSGDVARSSSEPAAHAPKLRVKKGMPPLPKGNPPKLLPVVGGAALPKKQPKAKQLEPIKAPPALPIPEALPAEQDAPLREEPPTQVPDPPAPASELVGPPAAVETKASHAGSLAGEPGAAPGARDIFDICRHFLKKNRLKANHLYETYGGAHGSMDTAQVALLVQQIVQDISEGELTHSVAMLNADGSNTTTKAEFEAGLKGCRTVSTTVLQADPSAMATTRAACAHLSRDPAELRCGKG
ncbi:hypothetical protein CYMTET_18571 [Cymbomonas tetramitiformis]|uniref:Uncharacterized protein n=1 Tax=Cymbomonas tetramitiformis TaxID=36881 RepID=A0AAE0G7S0_9CHLO|nr:hypothetical protein CYMTET_18571 [Cymbomonas tetramitiformis]